MKRSYQQLVLRKREVELEMKFKGPSPTNNNLAIQLHAKINNKNHSKSAGMMAMACTNEVNIAHVANYGDLCRHVLCRGKRKSAKHLWSETNRLFFNQIMQAPNMIEEISMDSAPIKKVINSLDQVLMYLTI